RFSICLARYYLGNKKRQVLLRLSFLAAIWFVVFVVPPAFEEKNRLKIPKVALGIKLQFYHMYRGVG
ncbi:MAG: hypothetical protein WBG48_07470, partial [Pricia sp.]